MQEVAVVSGAARLSGLVYLAAGAGLHPVVVFLASGTFVVHAPPPSQSGGWRP